MDAIYHRLPIKRFPAAFSRGNLGTLPNFNTKGFLFPVRRIRDPAPRMRERLWLDQYLRQFSCLLDILLARARTFFLPREFRLLKISLWYLSKRIIFRVVTFKFRTFEIQNKRVIYYNTISNVFNQNILLRITKDCLLSSQPIAYETRVYSGCHVQLVDISGGYIQLWRQSMNSEQVLAE